jgi:protein-disulfide isomerase
VETTPNIQSDQSAELMTVSRVTLNYVVIAIAFLLLGMVIGAIGFERYTQANQAENAALIDEAVARALDAGLGDNIESVVQEAIASAVQGDAGAAAPSLQPDERYDVVAADNPSVGPEDALVTIVEFSDFQCGYCGRFADETLQRILDTYEGRIRFVYRDYIIFGQESYAAALAAECADDQNAFWEFHNLIFSNQQSLGREQYISFATQLELDVEQFTQCYDTEAHRTNIAEDYNYGESLGITGTPTFFINGRFVSGAQPYETFVTIIDEELARAASGADAES